MADDKLEERPYTIESFRSAQLKVPRALIGKGVLYAGGKIILHGRRKYKKSMLIWWMLNQMRDGNDVLSLPVEPNGVSGLYLQAEIHESLFQKRDKAMQGVFKPGTNTQNLYIWNTKRLKLDTPEGLALLDQWISNLQPLDLLVIDPLYKFISQDITNPAQVTQFMDNIDLLIEKHKIGVIIIAHPRKSYGDAKGGKGEDDPDDLLGASTWYNWVDAILKITHPGNHPQDVYTLKFSDLRYAEEEIPDVVYGFDRKTLNFYETMVV